MSNEESDEITKYEIKIKIINFLELAYKSNGEITAKLIKSIGPFTLKVDQDGSASLSGKAGVVRFSADEETDKFGIGFSYVNVMMFGNKDGKIHYTATVGFKNGPNIQITSILDVEKLILSCTGLLCRAAQSLKNRHQQIDKSLWYQ